MIIAKLLKLLRDNDGQTLFGDKGKAHPKYKKYAVICHPDKNGNSDESQECFRLLEQRAMESGSGIIITSKTGEYEINRNPFASGDISDVFLTTDGNNVVKITRNDKHISLMQNEFSVLEYITPDPNKYRIFWGCLPHIQDSFTISTRNYPNRRAHVMDYKETHVSLGQIKKVHPHLDIRSFAWIFKRILMALAIVHEKGYVHGCLIPQHFLVDKVDHSGRLIDFIHAVEIGEKVRVKTKDKSFYAPEILNKEGATTETDIYMAGKVAIYLLGGHLSSNSLPGTVPSRIRGFLRAILIDKQNARPNNAWQLHEDFSEILERLFGSPQYHELTGV